MGEGKLFGGIIETYHYIGDFITWFHSTIGWDVLLYVILGLVFTYYLFQFFNAVISRLANIEELLTKIRNKLD
jgi:hypothetical protein